MNSREAEPGRPTLVGASLGDPLDPHTASGAAKYLLDALERRYGPIQRVDYNLTGWQRALAGARSFRLPRDRWRRRYLFNRLSLRFRSQNLRRRLAAISDPFDLVVQVFGLIEPPGWPYVVYLDVTWRTVAESWPQWIGPLSREFEFWCAIEERMYRNAHRLFTMGQRAADSLIAFYGVDPEQVTVVGGGTNFESLPEVWRRDFGGHSPVILFVGRDYLRKGGDVLLAAFRLVRERVPHARLRFVGTSSALREPGVEVLGLISDRSVMEELYRSATIFCMPSRHEPYGFVLLEAMAHGLPCIATTVDAIPEIVVDGETGLLVPPDDPRALASALVAILEHPDRAESFGFAGRRRVERELNWDRVVDRMAPGLEQAAG